MPFDPAQQSAAESPTPGARLIIGALWSSASGDEDRSFEDEFVVGSSAWMPAAPDATPPRRPTRSAQMKTPPI
jgi:hypothetical protein